MTATTKLVFNTMGRILAVFVMNAMAIIGSSSLIGGIEPHKAAFLAGATAAAQVLQKLARLMLMTVRSLLMRLTQHLAYRRRKVKITFT